MTTVIPIRAVGAAGLAPANQCRLCRGKICCTYWTQQIDAPRSMEDFDLLLWQLSHERTQLYKDDDGWFLLVNNPCRHLRSDGGCGIYERRPQICRDHSTDDCEFEGPAGEEDFELYFPDYESLLTYCRRRFKGWDRRFPAASPAGAQ